VFYGKNKHSELNNISYLHGASMKSTPDPHSKIGLVHIVGLFLLTVFLSVSVTLWVVKYFSFPYHPAPNKLNQAETIVLRQKLWFINSPHLATQKGTEEISFNEKELNALLDGNITRNIENVHIKDGNLLIKLKE
jgi:hypothetical protein